MWQGGYAVVRLTCGKIVAGTVRDIGRNFFVLGDTTVPWSLVAEQPHCS